MTDRELMQQALDAFGGLLTFNPLPAEYKQGRDVVAALRDRLAQPEQELMIDCPRCGHCCPQPNQEPVAHVEYIPCCTDQSCPKCKTATPPAAQPEQNCVGWFGYDTGVRAWFETNKGDDDSIPLYAAPRQWVGLTNNEIKSLPSWWPSYEDAPALIQLVKDVEAKLKEKNT